MTQLTDKLAVGKESTGNDKTPKSFLLSEYELFEQARIEKVITEADIINDNARRQLRTEMKSTLFSFLKDGLNGMPLTEEKEPGKYRVPIQYQRNYKQLREDLWKYMAKAMKLKEPN